MEDVTQKVNFYKLAMLAEVAKMSDLSRGETIVLEKLVKCSGNGTESFPRLCTLAGKCKYSERQTQRHLTSLERERRKIRSNGKTGGRGHATIYVFLFEPTAVMIRGRGRPRKILQAPTANQLQLPQGHNQGMQFLLNTQIENDVLGPDYRFFPSQTEEEELEFHLSDADRIVEPPEVLSEAEYAFHQNKSAFSELWKVHQDISNLAEMGSALHSALNQNDPLSDLDKMVF